jgi:hypothetical protein
MPAPTPPAASLSGLRKRVAGALASGLPGDDRLCATLLLEKVDRCIANPASAEARRVAAGQYEATADLLCRKAAMWAEMFPAMNQKDAA